MKRFFCFVLLLVILCASACAENIRTAQYETVILGKSTELTPPQLTSIASMKGGETYELLEIIDQTNAEEQESWVQAWLNTYILHLVRYTNPHTEEVTEGYIVAGYVPQDVNAIPEITQEYGRLVTIEGRSCDKLTFEMVDKWDLGYTLVKPPEGSVSLEEALRIALDALMETYGETEATLKRLRFTCGHLPANEYHPMYWQFDFFSSLYALDGYSVCVASEDGQVFNIAGPGDGVG